MQMGRCKFDVEKFVLSCPAFRGKHATPVNLHKITIGKLIPLFDMRGLLVVDSQIPFSVFFDPVLVNELVLLLRRGSVLAPCIPLVDYDLSFTDKLFSMIVCSRVPFFRHLYVQGPRRSDFLLSVM